MAKVIDYNDLNDTIINYLKLNNTSSAAYSVSLSLPVAVVSDNIIGRDLDVYPVRNITYPNIMCQIVGDSQDIAEFGFGDVNYNVRINGVLTLAYMKREKDVTDTEIYNMARNVNAIIKGYIGLGNYNKNGLSVNYWKVNSTDFGVGVRKESAFVRNARINFVIDAHLT